MADNPKSHQKNQYQSNSDHRPPVIKMLEQHVQGLRPGGGDNWSGFCPLHGETPGRSKPSFSINASTGLWYCFSGCGGGGLPHLLRLLGMSRQKIEFTLQTVPLEKPDDKPERVEDIFRVPNPLPERILGLFESCPLELVESGFSEDILWDHEVGYDSERKMITFPIRDLYGTLAGICGRRTIRTDVEKYGKYKVYSSELAQIGLQGEYPLSKVNFAWRWDRVYPKTINEREPVVYVTEGFKACLWMVQHGYESTIALMGTSLGHGQQLFLERLGARIIWVLDNDPAGRAGVTRNSHKISGCRQYAVCYPNDVKQPDDTGNVDALIRSAIPIAEWKKENR